MKKYEALVIKLLVTKNDVVTLSWGEEETQKSEFDNAGFDIDWNN